MAASANVKDAALEQDFERDGRSDDGEEPFELAVAHGEPETIDRNPEAAGFARDLPASGAVAVPGSGGGSDARGRVQEHPGECRREDGF